MKRREFTKAIGLSALALQRVPLGVCNHSLRSMKPNARQLIEYAIEQNLDSVLLNTLQPFENHMGDLRSSELLALIQECGSDIC